MSAPIITTSTTLNTPIGRAISPELNAETSREARSESSKLRLTRRGRAVIGSVATLLLVGLLAAIAMFGGSQAVATAASGNSEFGYVVAQPGDSLWKLASELDPNADPRDLVAEIVRLNQLETSAIQAGEPFAVPLRYAEDPGVVKASSLGL